MSTLDTLVRQLREEHARLSKQMQGVSAAMAAFGAAYEKPTGTRRKMSAAARERIAAAQRERWARVKAKKSGSVEAKQSGSVKATKSRSSVLEFPPKRKLSAKALRNIRAAQKKRRAAEAAKKSA